MKVILLGDVKALGSRGTGVDVAEGYANNFLLPRGLAAEASKGAMAQLEQQNKAKAKRDAEDLASAKEIADRIEAQAFRVEAKAGGNGKLFGTVTNAQVADAIHEALGITVDRHKIELKDGIKAVGTYPLQVRLGKSIIAKTTVQVVAA